MKLLKNWKAALIVGVARAGFNAHSVSKRVYHAPLRPRSGGSHNDTEPGSLRTRSSRDPTTGGARLVCRSTAPGARAPTTTQGPIPVQPLSSRDPTTAGHASSVGAPPPGAN